MPCTAIHAGHPNQGLQGYSLCGLCTPSFLWLNHDCWRSSGWHGLSLVQLAEKPSCSYCGHAVAQVLPPGQLAEMPSCTSCGLNGWQSWPAAQVSAMFSCNCYMCTGGQGLPLAQLAEKLSCTYGRQVCVCVGGCSSPVPYLWQDCLWQYTGPG